MKACQNFLNKGIELNSEIRGPKQRRLFKLVLGRGKHICWLIWLLLAGQTINRDFSETTPWTDALIRDEGGRSWDRIQNKRH